MEPGGFIAPRIHRHFPRLLSEARVRASTKTVNGNQASKVEMRPGLQPTQINLLYHEEGIWPGYFLHRHASRGIIYGSHQHLFLFR